MKNNCPIDDLLKYIKEANNNPRLLLPKKLLEHSKHCESCRNIIANPDDWDLVLNMHEKLSNHSHKKSSAAHELSIGQVCRVKIPDSTNSLFILITNISSLKERGYIRVSPIAVSPIEDNLDKETDILISASQMPTGLPSLIEWWNDRPIMANIINKVYGSISNEIFLKIKERIEKQPNIKNITKSILLFREIEKNKGNIISASFFEKNLDTEELITKNELSETNIIPFYSARKLSIIINNTDLLPANEELKVAAASSDIFTVLKDYLKQNFSESFKATKIDDGSNSFTIESSNKKEFTLVITDLKGKKTTLTSNKKGKLYLKEGLDNFEKIEFIQ